jgi:hypothetical protein
VSGSNRTIWTRHRGTFGCLLLVFYTPIVTPDDDTVDVPKNVGFMKRNCSTSNKITCARVGLLFCYSKERIFFSLYWFFGWIRCIEWSVMESSIVCWEMCTEWSSRDIFWSDIPEIPFWPMTEPGTLSILEEVSVAHFSVLFYVLSFLIMTTTRYRMWHQNLLLPWQTVT